MKVWQAVKDGFESVRRSVSRKPRQFEDYGITPEALEGFLAREMKVTYDRQAGKEEYVGPLKSFRFSGGEDGETLQMDHSPCIVRDFTTGESHESASVTHHLRANQIIEVITREGYFLVRDRKSRLWEFDRP